MPLLEVFLLQAVNINLLELFCAVEDIFYRENFVGMVKSIVQSFWYILCCKFFATKENKNDQKYPIPPTTSNYQSFDTANLLNIAVPENVDIVFKPQ